MKTLKSLFSTLFAGAVLCSFLVACTGNSTGTETCCLDGSKTGCCVTDKSTACPMKTGDKSGTTCGMNKSECCTTTDKSAGCPMKTGEKTGMGCGDKSGTGCKMTDKSGVDEAAKSAR